MKKYYLIGSILILLFSCTKIKSGKNKGDDELNTQVENNRDTSLSRNEKILYENVTLRYGEFINLENGYRILPVKLKEIYASKDSEGELWFSNLLIIDSKNNVKSLDSLGNWYIEDVEIIKYWPKDSDFTEDENPTFTYALVHNPFIFEKYILLTLETAGTKVSKENLEKKSAPKQTAIAMLNPTGDNFTLVTPSNSQVQNYTFDPGSNSIYVGVIVNSNGDETYNEKDPLVYYAVTLENGKIVSKPLIPASLEEKLKKEYLQKLEINGW
jgi:hypothetical protein